ncbi:MAG: hypothetical protein ABSE25_09555 [Syntrophorhabdales bacterium]
MLWTHLHPPAAPSAQFTPAPPIPQAPEIKVVTVPGPPQIVTVEKQTVVRDLKLPDEIAKDPDKQVTATAQVANIDGGKTDAVAIMDTKTGQSIIETKRGRHQGRHRNTWSRRRPVRPLDLCPDRGYPLGALWRYDCSDKPPAHSGSSRTDERTRYAGRELQVVRVSATA